MRKVLRRVLRWIDPPNPLLMPLRENINSNDIKAPFLAGENIKVQAGTFVTDATKIGGETYVGFRCTIGDAVIGRYVSIANNVSLGLAEHHLDRLSTCGRFEEPLPRVPCVIEADAWIGEGAIIRLGVTIGVGAVVGANSFVNRDVAPFSIVAGSPARVIGRRLTEAQAEAVLQSKWWELPFEKAKAALDALSPDTAGP